MKTEQAHWSAETGWNFPTTQISSTDFQLVLAFGCTQSIKTPSLIHDIRTRYPHAIVFGCTTAGEILDTFVYDDTIVVTAVSFEHSSLRCKFAKIHPETTSYQTGAHLARQIDKNGLVHVFVLSDGLHINGSALVAGLSQNLPAHVAVTGGLAGDGSRFQETFVLADDIVEENLVAALAFYGDRISIGFGSMGGWDSFGPERLITRSAGNTLYEIDGKSALQLYKTYLGDHARDLPSSALLFPLSIRSSQHPMPVVRTILAVNEEDQSMTFAGDVPEGASTKFMKANFERLITGAQGAALTSYEANGSFSPDLAILISCIGRKLILKQRIEEEVEGVRSILGESTTLSGFYSYGEISPFTPGVSCELHNQTMTITTISER